MLTLNGGGAPSRNQHDYTDIVSKLVKHNAALNAGTPQESSLIHWYRLKTYTTYLSSVSGPPSSGRSKVWVT